MVTNVTRIRSITMTRATLCECIAKGNRVRYDNSEYIPTHYILSIKGA